MTLTLQERLELVVKAIDDKRAEDIVVLKMEGISPVADYFIICEGNSEKQVQAVAREIKEVAGEHGLPLRKFEGFDTARWVLADLEDIVVHVFHRDERDYYNLEKLWADAPHVDVVVD